MNRLSVYQQLVLICFVSMLALITLGMVSKVEINKVFNSSSQAVIKTTPTYIQFFEINRNLNNVIQRSLVHMIATDEDSMMEMQLEIDDAKEKLQLAVDKLSQNACEGKSCIHDEDEQRKLSFIKSELASYEAVREHAFELAKSKNHAEAEQVLKNEVLPALDSLNDAIQAELDYNKKLASAGMAKAQQEEAESVKLTMLVALVALFVLVVIAFLVFKSLQRQLGLEPRKLAQLAQQFCHGQLTSPIVVHSDDHSSVAYSIKSLQTTLNEIVQALNRVSALHDAGEVDATVDDSQFQGNFGEMARGINRMVQTHVNTSKKVVDMVEAFGQGNFDESLPSFPGKQVYINHTIESVRSNIKGFIHEMNAMSHAHGAGEIEVFMNEDKYQGAYKEMASGLNAMVQDHLDVNQKAMLVVSAFGEGDFATAMQDFPGKKALIKDTIERVRANIKMFIADMQNMSQQHALGNTEARIDINKYSGVYQQMAEGVNQMVAEHIADNHQTIEVVKAFCDGDFDKPLNRFPGKKAFINTAIEQVRLNLRALSEDAIMLSNAAANGEIEVRADTARHRGDFRKIIEGVNQTLDVIVEPILVVKDAVNAINNACYEISHGNNDLSKRTEKQASSLQETAASMSELASSVVQNAQHTQQANLLANEASSVAQHGGEIVAKVVETMSGLHQSAHKIEEITSVIDSIAFQTNILALNAAVEAARAGESGRGFAVVAGEVRILAQRSATAAKEIKLLIDESVDKAMQGTQQVEVAGQTMVEIVAAVQKVKDIISNISLATTHQSQGIQQVNQAVNQMDEVTQQNSALVEEAAAAAESLLQQANSLSSTVSVFKLNAAQATDTYTFAGVHTHSAELLNYA
jgi:methyl-accepting chemotaxis protein